MIENAFSLNLPLVCSRPTQLNSLGCFNTSLSLTRSHHNLLESKAKTRPQLAKPVKAVRYSFLGGTSTVNDLPIAFDKSLVFCLIKAPFLKFQRRQMGSTTLD